MDPSLIFSMPQMIATFSVYHAPATLDGLVVPLLRKFTRFKIGFADLFLERVDFLVTASVSVF